MRRIFPMLFLLVLVLSGAGPLRAQLPFYTDDTPVTEQGKFHMELSNEIDSLQLQYPNLRQNTVNVKLNYGLPRSLELDVDVPYISIRRDTGNEPSNGIGDTNLGVKWNFLKEAKGHRHPSMGASFYTEFPTGDASQQLGSGVRDYALNVMVQKSFTEKTRMNGNLGFLAAGNTSTGVLGTQNTRGQVYTGGLSMLHDLNEKLTLGGEVYGAYTDSGDLGRTQLQGMAGGQYALRKNIALCFGLLGGVYVASPRIGGQVGLSIDFP